VETVRAWAPDPHVVVKFTSAELRAKSAWVVCCQAVSDKEFAVRLEFLRPWIAALSGLSQTGPQETLVLPYL
jgi:hypothetical protein